MREYLYINEERLAMYVSQLPRVRKSRFVPSVGMTTTGPRVDLSASSVNEDALSSHFEIERLMEHLRDTGQLSGLRPEWDNYDEEGRYDFIFETMDATKVILMTDALEPVKGTGLVSANVWVSDPDPASVNPSDESVSLGMNITGSFLYLIEAFWKDQRQALVSGVSALKLLAQELEVDIWDVEPEDIWEPLGRGSFEHPVKKLTKLGGIVSDSRRISSLYKVRLVSNEQCYTLNGHQARVCDVLGYPLFVETHDYRQA